MEAGLEEVDGYAKEKLRDGKEEKMRRGKGRGCGYNGLNRLPQGTTTVQEKSYGNVMGRGRHGGRLGARKAHSSKGGGKREMERVGEKGAHSSQLNCLLLRARFRSG